MWHIKKLIKQHDHYTGAPCAGDIKRTLKCAVLSTQHNATYVSSFEGACNWNADCRNVPQSCCQRIECSFFYQCSFREFGSTSNWPHNRRPRVTSPVQDLHSRLLHLRDCLRPATRTADETVGLDNQRISAQSVRNLLREAHLRACHHLQGLALTAVGVVTDFSWQMLTFDGHWHAGEVCSSWINPGFNCTLADDRPRVWHRLSEQFAYVNVVNRMPNVAVGLWYGQA